MRSIPPKSAPTVDLTRRHSLPRDQARQAADRVIKEMETGLGLAGLISQWRRDTLHLSASEGPAKGMTGELALGTDAVRVKLTLSPTLRMMRKTVETSLAHFLKRAFPDGS